MLLISRSLQLSLLLICVLHGGCSSMAERAPNLPDLRVLREEKMKLAWVDQPYKALTERFGAPAMMLSIPGYNPSWEASVVVYEALDSASDCIDAFTVAHIGKPVVYNYFCR